MEICVILKHCSLVSGGSDEILIVQIKRKKLIIKYSTDSILQIEIYNFDPKVLLSWAIKTKTEV